MGRIVGMDEAGYGPNLGPLVITATVWEVDGRPRDVDFWRSFAEVVDRTGRDADERLCIADSKQVFTPGKGLLRLETAVLAALGVCGIRPVTLAQLLQAVAPGWPDRDRLPPWLDCDKLALPREADPHCIAQFVQRWSRAAESAGIRLRSIRCEVIPAGRFNRLLAKSGNKATLLSEAAFGLLGEVWHPSASEATLVLADKHGGRNRYHRFLQRIAGDAMIFRLEESTARSRYRVGQSELRFETGAERHLPVALASMVSKYIRELAMALFNRFWCDRIPGLKPTQGYPVDARRFHEAIRTVQAELGIADEVLWRSR